MNLSFYTIERGSGKDSSGTREKEYKLIYFPCSLEIRSMFLTIKEAKSGADFNPRSGAYKKDHHCFYHRFHMFMKGILKCVVVMARG